MSKLVFPQRYGRPILVGEVLFDVFPDASDAPGGAPFNVAWHLQGLGLNPLLISRVGKDEDGERILDIMSEWGMDKRGIQIDAGHATGRVGVDLAEGSPEYTIPPDQAYDCLEPEAALTALSGKTLSLLYHGSLIARGAASHSVLHILRSLPNLPIFVDVNLRRPWWNRDPLDQLLHDTRWVKLNATELADLADANLTRLQIVDAAREFRRRYELELLIVTEGAEGAYAITRAGTRHQPAHPVDDPVDTLGAGDAFSAVTILGLVSNWPVKLILARATEFAAAVCRQRGAVCRDTSFYADCLERWSA